MAPANFGLSQIRDLRPVKGTDLRGPVTLPADLDEVGSLTLPPHRKTPDEMTNANETEFEIVQAVGPYHDFLLLRYDTYPPQNWENTQTQFRRQKRGGQETFDNFISVSDDILRQLYDHLSWLSTATTPWRNKPSEPWQGLHWYGPTIINHRGSHQLRTITGSWANIIEIGPDPAKLPAGKIFISDENGHCVPGTERQSLTSASRSSVVQQLRAIEKYAQTVTNSPFEFYILHLGI